jgi:hypothetical protein
MHAHWESPTSQFKTPYMRQFVFIRPLQVDGATQLGEVSRNDLVPVHTTLDDLPPCRHADLRLRGQRALPGQTRRILPQLPRRAAETFTRGGHFPLRLQNGSFHERRWAPLLEHRTRELQVEWESGAVPVTVFGTIIHHETLYWVRRSPTFVSRAFLTFALLRVSRPTSACMVENHAHHRTQRGRPV